MLTLEFIGRLLLAGALGAAIGLEREYRAKVAGMRTHFLVSLGSALIMIVSQWGFQDSAGVAGIRPGDAARVAAQIVSGIGFIGAGTIMMQKQAVRGLTTAAGLWVAAGIGMAVGGGLYVLGLVTTLLTLISLEIFQCIFRNMKTECLQLVFSTRNRNNLIKITNELNNNGYRIINCSVTSDHTGKQERLRVKMYIRLHAQSDENVLAAFLQQFPDIMIEKIE
nr:MgtC/SapB family protein [Victivallis vadensis]